MTRAAAVMVVMVVGLRVTCRRALKCLISALALSAGARMEVISSPVPPGVGIWAGVLDRDLDADAGPDVALACPPVWAAPATPPGTAPAGHGCGRR